MTKLTPEVKKFIENNKQTTNKSLSNKIAEEFGFIIHPTTIGRYKRKKEKDDTIQVFSDAKSTINDISNIIETEVKPLVNKSRKIVKEKKHTREELHKILMEKASFSELDKIVTKRETGSAEALFVKFNPKGEREDYNRRNKNRYILISKATIDIHLELILDVLKEEELIK